MECIICGTNKKESNIKTYNGNPLCLNCLSQQKSLVNQFCLKKSIFYPECDEIIEKKLYLGNYDFASNENLLSKINVSSILVCGSELKCKFPYKYNYLKLNLHDYEDDSLLPHIEKSVKFIVDNFSNGVLVHCKAGISRSPSIIIAFLIKSYKYTYDEAYEYVKSKRQKIKPNDKFISELKKLK